MHISKNLSHDFPQRKAYTEAFDMLSAAKSLRELEIAAKQADILIKQNNIDERDAKQLEDHGINQFNKIQKELRNIEFISRTNKRKG